MDTDLLREFLPSWRLALLNANRSQGTIATYRYSIELFLDWHDGEVTRETVRNWLADMDTAPATIRLRLQALKSYANWLLAEGEIDANPLLGIAPPKLHAKVTPSLTDGQVAAMIAACKGNTLADRRDEAAIRFLAETGVRAREAISVAVDDVNLETRTAIIRQGKGGDGRIVPFSVECAAALDRYLRLRRRQHLAESSLWIGVGGKTFGYYGLRKSLSRRAVMASVPGFHLHLMRHTAATRWLRNGGSEGGLMAIAGWKDRTMLDRYTKASASERAISEAARLKLGAF